MVLEAVNGVFSALWISPWLDWLVYWDACWSIWLDEKVTGASSWAVPIGTPLICCWLGCNPATADWGISRSGSGMYCPSVERLSFCVALPAAFTLLSDDSADLSNFPIPATSDPLW